MKRILMASALTLTAATAAMSATSNEIARIQQYVPDADISTWSQPQVDQALNIINSTDNRSDAEAQLQALMSDDMTAVSGAELTEAERTQLDQYVDGVDYSQLPQARVDAALSVLNSEMSESDRAGRIEELLMGDDMAALGNSATEAEIAMINQAAPNVDVSTLSDPQVDAILVMIEQSDSADIENEIEAYVQ
ncbi:hypothetical protein [Roseivivax sediminis]|uniref:LTXXQ motif family protein n=1 Tax=Roseivivax sediminis TaxID=936889 RepID=A0A1I2DQQ6_9RHOB|nr:hypothetical protein [Roseivivax sediminis]SFE82876.1 hypothetical protein SAMN04515678_1187 [Roseivivax sediminis]